jgi:hypothetical protein
MPSSPEEISQWLQKTCITTEAEKDPRKPLMVDGQDMVLCNPDYDPALVEREATEKEIQRRKTNLGTSFFLNFDPLCHVHQIRDWHGDAVRREIARQLVQRFLLVFGDACDEGLPMEALANRLQVNICDYGQAGFNNGEVYMWLPGIALNEDFVFQVLRALYNSINQDPITVFVEGSGSEQVIFYGYVTTNAQCAPPRFCLRGFCLVEIMLKIW